MCVLLTIRRGRNYDAEQPPVARPVGDWPVDRFAGARIVDGAVACVSV